MSGGGVNTSVQVAGGIGVGVANGGVLVCTTVGKYWVGVDSRVAVAVISPCSVSPGVNAKRVAVGIGAVAKGVTVSDPFGGALSSATNPTQ